MMPLSPTEFRVVQLLAQGARHEEIRLRLDVSKNAITSALKRARDKAGATSNEHLIALLYRTGVLR